MPAGGSGRGLSMNACGTIGGRPMLTFYELVVVVLQSRALLSHVCCSTCTQGCMGLAAAVVIAFVGPGVSQLLVRTHAGWHRAVLVCFDAQPTAANPEYLPRPRARRRGGCAPDAAAEQKSQKTISAGYHPGDQSPLCLPLNYQNAPRPRLQTGVGDTRPRATNRWLPEPPDVRWSSSSCRQSRRWAPDRLDERHPP